MQKSFFLLYLFCFLFIGVQNVVEVHAKSYDSVSKQFPIDAEHFAYLTAIEMEDKYPIPTQFALIADKKRAVFINKLADYLRQQGHIIGKNPTVTLEYTLDFIDKSRAYLKIQGSDGFEIGIVRDLGEKSLPSMPVSYSTTSSDSYQVSSQALHDISNSNEVSTQNTAYTGHTLLSHSPTVASVSPSAQIGTQPIAQKEQVELAYHYPIGTIMVSRLKLRSQASTKSTQLASLLKGETFAVLDKSETQEFIQGNTDYWYQIETNNNRIGWVFGAFIDIDEAENRTIPRDLDRYQTSEVYQNQDLINVYEMPYKAPILSWRLEKGSLMRQLDELCKANNWKLIWNADFDLELEASSSFNGEFITFIQNLFTNLQEQNRHSLRVSIFKANNVIEISGE